MRNADKTKLFQKKHTDTLNKTKLRTCAKRTKNDPLAEKPKNGVNKDTENNKEIKNIESTRWGEMEEEEGGKKTV